MERAVSGPEIRIELAVQSKRSERGKVVGTVARARPVVSRYRAFAAFIRDQSAFTSSRLAIPGSFGLT